MKALTIEKLLSLLTSTFEGLKVITTWGETSLFYNPTNQYPHGIYFCTIKENDSEYDQASNLSRKDVLRFNFGISKEAFIQLFKSLPKRPAKGKTIEGDYDFTLLDKLQPHPIYGWMGWIAVLNPTEKTFNELLPLLADKYEIIKKKFEQKTSKH